MSKKSLQVLFVCLLVLTLSMAAVALTSTGGAIDLTKESVRDILKEIAGHDKTKAGKSAANALETLQKKV